MASESEMETNPEDLRERLRDKLIELNRDLKILGYDYTDAIKHLPIDTGTQGDQIPKLRAWIKRLQNIQGKTPPPPPPPPRPAPARAQACSSSESC